MKTNLKSQSWGSESSRTDGLVDTEPQLCDFRLVFNPYLQLSCLFYLFLLVPRFLVGITLVVWLIVLHKIATAIGGGVSVAKAQLGRL